MKRLILLPLVFISVLFYSADNFAQNSINDLTIPQRFPYVDPAVSTYDQPQPVQLNDGRLMMVYTANDTIYSRISSDEGLSWGKSSVAATYSRTSDDNCIIASAVVTKTGRVIVFYSIALKFDSYTKPLLFTYSDDNGINWSQNKNVIGSISLRLPSAFVDKNNTIWVLGLDQRLLCSTDNGISWTYKRISGNNFHSFVQLKDSTLIGFYQRTATVNYIKTVSDVYLKKSTDNGATWKDSMAVAVDTLNEERPRALMTSDGTIYVFYQIKHPLPFDYVHPGSGYYSATGDHYDIYFRKSTDNGNTWSEPVQFTKYAGDDCDFNITLLNQKIYIAFISDRYSLYRQIWTGIIGTTSDETAPPVLYKFTNSSPVLNKSVTVTAYLGSHIGISEAEILFKVNDGAEQNAKMYDDGLHNDGTANDNIWAGELPAIDLRNSLVYSFKLTDKNQASVTFAGKRIFAQVLHSWMAGGSLHNFYSNMGAEIEFELNDKGYFLGDSYGWSYPGLYKSNDMQTWKGLWIGSTDFTDENGISYPYKVVHVGPRVTGQEEFFPTDFKTYSRFTPTRVVVNNKESFNHPMQADIIDPSMNADRMIINTINTQLGLTVRRRIMQFSRQFNDNYIIQEYTFKNTGNTDADDGIELPLNTLKGLYFHFNYRWSINRQMKPPMGSSTYVYAFNTMYDARGDGVLPDPPGENYRTAFAWHGYIKYNLPYNNIGGPIWKPSDFNYFVPKDDTTGRLAAPQFAGVLTLHNDKSPMDHSDDPSLPHVTYLDNDDPLMQLNSSYDQKKMKSEYLNIISRPNDSIRHAYIIHPAAMAGGTVNFPEFANQTKDPSSKAGGGYTGGGYSVHNSYGPYTLARGDSITIIIAEGAASISREASLEMGKKYKAAFGTPDWNKVEKEKNLLVLTGKDSLMQTWKRATENYKSGWKLPIPPNPPEEFTVTSLEDKINLKWTASDPSIKGFEIYRTSGKYENDYSLIKALQAGERSYQDSDIVKGTSYFYYILSAGDDVAANSAAGTPAYKLKSSRYYTQTYDGASIGTSGINEQNNVPGKYELYANYPNPFNPSTTISYDLPVQSHVDIKIFDMLGRQISTIVDQTEAAGHHKILFNAGHLSSGLYLYRIKAGDFIKTQKMLLVK